MVAQSVAFNRLDGISKYICTVRAVVTLFNRLHGPSSISQHADSYSGYDGTVKDVVKPRIYRQILTAAAEASATGRAGWVTVIPVNAVEFHYTQLSPV